MWKKFLSIVINARQLRADLFNGFNSSEWVSASKLWTKVFIEQDSRVFDSWKIEKYFQLKQG